jgi:antitoxin (DNA-binding transcriptional repressor) of toxin-antitoxin stability system
MNVAEAEKNFAGLVNQVHTQGITIDLERDDKVIARLVPAAPPSPLTVGELSAFLRSLPSLGEDADAFARDVGDIRAPFLAETSAQLG